MKPFYKRGVLAAVVLAAFGHDGFAQNTPYGAPSVLPLPEARTGVPVSFQTAAGTGYRSTLVANQESVNAPPPNLDNAGDVPDGAAAAAGNGVGGQWWNPFGGGGMGAGLSCGSTCGTGCCGRWLRRGDEQPLVQPLRRSVVCVIRRFGDDAEHAQPVLDHLRDQQQPEPVDEHQTGR